MATFNAMAATLNACKRLGWLAANVEKFNGYTRKSTDLFGFADIVAIRQDKMGATLIQGTAGSHGRERINKIIREKGEDASFVLRYGNRIEVWCWRKYSLGRREDGSPKRKRVDAMRWQIELMGSKTLVATPLPSFLELLDELTVPAGPCKICKASPAYTRKSISGRRKVPRA